MTKSPMSRFVIKEPWQIRLREFLAMALICSWRGHKRSMSFSGWPKACRRCGR